MLQKSYEGVFDGNSYEGSFDRNSCGVFKKRKRLREISKKSRNASTIPPKKAKTETSNYIKKCSKRFNLLRKKWKKLRNINNNRGSFLSDISSDLLTRSSTLNSSQSTFISYGSSQSYNHPSSSSFSSENSRYCNKSNNRRNSSIAPSDFYSSRCNPYLSQYYNSHGLQSNQPKTSQITEKYISSYTSPRFSQDFSKKSTKSRSKKPAKKIKESFETVSYKKFQPVHNTSAKKTYDADLYDICANKTCNVNLFHTPSKTTHEANLFHTPANKTYDADLFNSLRKGISTLKNMTHKAKAIEGSKLDLFVDKPVSVETQTNFVTSNNSSLPSKNASSKKKKSSSLFSKKSKRTSENLRSNSSVSKKSKLASRSKKKLSEKRKKKKVIPKKSLTTNKMPKEKQKEKNAKSIGTKTPSPTEKSTYNSETQISEKDPSKVTKAFENPTKPNEPCCCMPWCCVCPEAQMMMEEECMCFEPVCNQSNYEKCYYIQECPEVIQESNVTKSSMPRNTENNCLEPACDQSKYEKIFCIQKCPKVLQENSVTKGSRPRVPEKSSLEPACDQCDYEKCFYIQKCPEFVQEYNMKKISQPRNTKKCSLEPACDQCDYEKCFYIQKCPEFVQENNATKSSQPRNTRTICLEPICDECSYDKCSCIQRYPEAIQKTKVRKNSHPRNTGKRCLESVCDQSSYEECSYIENYPETIQGTNVRRNRHPRNPRNGWSPCQKPHCVVQNDFNSFNNDYCQCCEMLPCFFDDGCAVQSQQLPQQQQQPYNSLNLCLNFGDKKTSDLSSSASSSASSRSPNRSSQRKKRRFQKKSVRSRNTQKETNRDNTLGFHNNLDGMRNQSMNGTGFPNDFGRVRPQSMNGTAFPNDLNGVRPQSMNGTAFPNDLNGVRPQSMNRTGFLNELDGERLQSVNRIEFPNDLDGVRSQSMNKTAFPNDLERMRPIVSTNRTEQNRDSIPANIVNVTKSPKEESSLKNIYLKEKLSSNKENLFKEKLLSLEDVIKMVFTGRLNLKDELIKLINTTIRNQPKPEVRYFSKVFSTSSIDRLSVGDANLASHNHCGLENNNKALDKIRKLFEANSSSLLPSTISYKDSEISTDDDATITDLCSKLRSSSNSKCLRKKVVKNLLAKKIDELSHKNRSLSQRIESSLKKNKYLLEETSKYELKKKSRSNSIGQLSSSECGSDPKHYLCNKRRSLSAEVSKRLQKISLLEKLAGTISNELLFPRPLNHHKKLKNQSNKTDGVQIHYVILNDKKGKMLKKSLTSTSLEKIASLLSIKDEKRINHFKSEPRVNSLGHRKRFSKEYNISNGCSKVYHKPHNLFFHQLQNPLGSCPSNIASVSEVSVMKPHKCLKQHSSQFVLEEASFAEELMSSSETKHTKQMNINFSSKNPFYNFYESHTHLPENLSCKGSESSGTKCFLNVFPKTKLISNKSQLTKTINKLKQSKRFRDKDCKSDVEKKNKLSEKKKEKIENLRKKILAAIEQIMIERSGKNQKKLKTIENHKKFLSSKPREVDLKIKNELSKRIDILKMEKYKNLNKTRKKDNHRKVENDEEDGDVLVTNGYHSAQTSSSISCKNNESSQIFKHNMIDNKDGNSFKKDEKLINKVKSIVQNILAKQKNCKKEKSNVCENGEKKKLELIKAEGSNKFCPYKQTLNKRPLLHATFEETPKQMKNLTEKDEIDFSRPMNIRENFSSSRAPKTIDRTCSRNIKNATSIITDRLRKHNQESFLENCSENLDDQTVSCEIFITSRESSNNCLNTFEEKVVDDDYCPTSSLYSKKASSIIKKRLTMTKTPSFFEPPMNYDYL